MKKDNISSEDDEDKRELLNETLEALTADNEALELEVKISRQTIQHFLNNNAPIICDQCTAELYNLCGILACTACRRAWDPTDNKWIWVEYESDKKRKEKE